MMYVLISLLSMLPTLLCIGISAWMVITGHPGWAFGFLITGLLILPDIKWTYKDPKK